MTTRRRMTRVRPLLAAGRSANITWYREPGADVNDELLWVEALRRDLVKVDGSWRKLDPPTYAITVHRGRHLVAEFRYEPKRAPRDGDVPAKTMTRLVAAALAV